MLREQKHLTKSEEEVMKIFWRSEEALTGLDVAERKGDATWSNGLVYNMVRSLIQKGMLTECGTVRSGSQYARKFVPSMTQEEYAASRVFAPQLEKLSVSGVIAALVKEEKGAAREETIAELEELIRQLQEDDIQG